MRPDLKRCERVIEMAIARPFGWAAARAAFGLWWAADQVARCAVALAAAARRHCRSFKACRTVVKADAR